MRDELGLKYKKEERAKYLKRDLQEQKAKIQNKIQKCRRHKRRRLRGYFLPLLSWRIQRNVDSVHRMQVAVTWLMNWWLSQLCLPKLPVS
jgi:hypothetical protein